MTTSRANRHAARRRMANTGERYTTALRLLGSPTDPGRCTSSGGCMSRERFLGSSSDTDSDALTCHMCGLPVCVACQVAAVDGLFEYCDVCGSATDQVEDTGVPMLHEVWDKALANGRCPVCAAGLPHVGTDCSEEPSRRIDTPHR